MAIEAIEAKDSKAVAIIKIAVISEEIQEVFSLKSAGYVKRRNISLINILLKNEKSRLINTTLAKSISQAF